jgi:hypothetical protein
MENFVGFLMIGFLINDETFGSVVDQFPVLVVLHRANFDSDRRNECFEGIDALLKVAVRDEFRVLARDEEDISKAQIVKMFGLGDDLGDAESGAKNWVIPGKSAILAVIHTLVREVERGKKSHRFAKVPTRQGLTLTGHAFELSVGAGVK